MYAEMTEIVMPGDTNHMGTAFGGKIMQWIDVCAAIAAQRFARGAVVTASIDQLDFKKPVRQGDVVTLKATVNAAWKTSMEVGVTVIVENPETLACFQACKAYLTFVAIDKDGKRREVSQRWSLTTPTDVRRHQEAQKRRANRLSVKK